MNKTTISELFTGYLSYLQNRNAASFDNAHRALTKIECALGEDTSIDAVTSDSICQILAQIYQRGSCSHAAWVRQLLMSVFRWGMRISTDYRVVNAVNYGIKKNPIESIPSDSKALTKSRERFFSKEEIPRYLQFLNSNCDHSAAGVLLIALLTGARIEEIATLKLSDFNDEKGIIFFTTTKTGNSHKIGLGEWAWSFLRNRCLGKNENDFIFPSVRHPDKSISINSIYVFFSTAHLKNACPRDSRRTFKTLAQIAGLKRETLDLIQNHRDGTIASKHYDKFFATHEAIIQMRDALNVWERWLLGIQRQKMVA